MSLWLNYLGVLIQQISFFILFATNLTFKLCQTKKKNLSSRKRSNYNFIEYFLDKKIFKNINKLKVFMIFIKRFF